MDERVCISPETSDVPERPSELRMLLVSRDAAWVRAVEGAAERLGGVDVLTCDAQGALARLAGTGSHYSHLLVDRNDAEGLLEELADLATEAAAPETDIRTILISGLSGPQHPV